MMWKIIQPIFTRYFIFPVWTLISGNRFLLYRKFSAQFQWKSREEQNSYQLQAVKNILVHAQQSTVYYSELFRSIGFDPSSLQSLAELSVIPILTKDIVRERFEDLRSIGFSAKELKKNATGGSTGIPMNFYVTKDRELRQAAAMSINYEWAGLGLGDRLGILWGAPFEISKYSSLKGKFENILLGRLFLPTFTLSDEIMHEYYQKIQLFKPRALLGYKSSLVYFAKFVERNNLATLNIYSAISGGETLYESEREYIATTLGCRVFNRYGGRDSGAVAAECPEEQRMHINNEVVFAETDGSGNILVTDLWNYGMPFIRYAPEDLGTIDESLCDCGRGSATFSNISGRRHDLLQKSNGEVVSGEFFPHLMKDVSDVLQFQVIQYHANELTVTIVAREGRLKEKDEGYLQKHIRSAFGNVAVVFLYRDSIEKSASGKFRVTISHIHEK